MVAFRDGVAYYTAVRSKMTVTKKRAVVSVSLLVSYKILIRGLEQGTSVPGELRKAKCSQCHFPYLTTINLYHHLPDSSNAFWI